MWTHVTSLYCIILGATFGVFCHWTLWFSPSRYKEICGCSQISQWLRSKPISGRHKREAMFDNHLLIGFTTSVLRTRWWRLYISNCYHNEAWGHIYVSVNSTIIGSGNGLSLRRRRAIILSTAVLFFTDQLGKVIAFEKSFKKTVGNVVFKMSTIVI